MVLVSLIYDVASLQVCKENGKKIENNLLDDLLSCSGYTHSKVMYSYSKERK